MVSGIAKGFAFRFLVKPEDTPLKKVICISCCMVVPMVLIMSLYGACEGAVHTGDWAGVPLRWLLNIPRNFVMALPLQLLIAGPLVRKVFRTAFPLGTVLDRPAGFLVSILFLLSKGFPNGNRSGKIAHAKTR